MASVSSQRSRRTLVILLASCAAVVLLLSQSAGTLKVHDLIPLSIAKSGSIFSQVTPQQRRITLIAIWDDDYMAPYIPSFFSAASRNADAVDLLFINILREGDVCLDVEPYIRHASNIKILCITNQEDKLLTRKYLCKNWNCTIEQAEQVDKHLKDREDWLHCDFKPFRGSIYKEWVKTSWWAWVDVDQMIGNFGELWPFDIVDNFDIVTMSEWDIGTIYLRGQFTAFKTDNPKMDEIWSKYLPSSSPEMLPMHRTGDLDEWDYSWFYMDQLKHQVDWIILPRGLGGDKFGANKDVSNGRRLFYVPVEMRRRDVTMLLDERYTPKAEPLFGAVEPFDVEKWAVPARELVHGDWLWNKPLMRDCDVEPVRCTALRESFWHASGQLLEYFDQRSRPRAPKVESYFGIEEKLLLHWQENKRQEWFDLPPDGIGVDDIVEVRFESVVAWNKHTLATTFEAVKPGARNAKTLENDLLAMGMWGVNGSNEMPLPPGLLGTGKASRDG